EVSGVSLPYEEISELRYRLGEISPNLLSYDEVEGSAFADIAVNSLASSATKPDSTPFTLPIKDFYMTDPISRASSTMAKCSLAFTQGQKLRSWLNERFQEIERPSFLGPLFVSELDFGDVPPTIEISNICDPIPEFYLPDDFDIYSQSASNLNRLIQSISKKYPNEGDEFEEDEFEEESYKHADSMKRDTDIQLEISIDYQGNMRISVQTELIVNQPTPAFMALPLTLTLTGFAFKVLKNVSKIEKFVVEQVRELVSRHLVYPNYHCLSLFKEDTYSAEGKSENTGSEIQSF
ncbi:Mitochondrial distribution and morphology protein 12, partial [Phlyctochytrium bullatum]